MRRILRRLLGLFLRPAAQYYLRRERAYRWHDLKLQVKPGVFHPGLFYSTSLLLKQLQEESLGGKSFLELGAGSGLIALYAAQQQARVTATDISPAAVQNIRLNAALNELHLQAIESDMFDDIPGQTFDYITVNPPYYKGKPASNAQYAWYAGEALEYFDRFFGGLRAYTHPQSRVFMVLSEDCDMESINRYAARYGYRLTEKRRSMKMLEWTIVSTISSK